MAYPLSNDVLNIFKAQYRQIANITFYGTTETKTITEDDIVQGGLSIDRYCVSGSRIEIGSAVASELTLTLNNKDGRFNDWVFEGAEVLVRIGTKKWDAHNWEKATEHFIPMGYFTIDNSPRKLSSISLTALDRMVNFDKDCEPEKLAFPMTVGTLLTTICDICNVNLHTDYIGLLNSSYIIQLYPSGDNLTYRQLLIWIGEITGTCSYMDWDGKLRLSWYGNSSVATIHPADRYTSDINENTVKISGVKIKKDDTEYLSGDDSYSFNIEGNALIQSGAENIADALYATLGGFTYTPFTCVAKPVINLYPMDQITFVNKRGTETTTIITNTTFTMNGSLAISGKGETATNDGYAKTNPLTKQESLIINTVKSIVNEQLNNRVQSVLDLNEAIAGALGLYKTNITHEDGSVSYYFHSNPVLTDSQTGDVIYTMNTGGFACCTTGWNGGNPVWVTGITKDGNAVFNFVSANGIEVSNANSEYSSKITPGVFEVWYRALKVLTMNADESEFNKVKFKNYAECGKIRIVPYTVNSVLSGTNLVYLD